MRVTARQVSGSRAATRLGVDQVELSGTDDGIAPR